jgi:hypothetical protein
VCPNIAIPPNRDDVRTAVLEQVESLLEAMLDTSFGREYDAYQDAHETLKHSSVVDAMIDNRSLGTYGKLSLSIHMPNQG